MQMIEKRTLGIGLIVTIGALFLGACSSVAVTPTSSPLETVSSQTPVETLTATSPALAEPEAPSATETMGEENTPIPTDETDASMFADVLSLKVSGSEGDYQFAVEIRSPDTGCEQYADWWEVITEDGELIYRRILAHSHVNEQPFTRSGGSVEISADTIVIVRAHMHPDGYGGAALRGSVNDGFEEISLDTDFAPELENVAPLPDGCAF